ncbi:MAG: hypothetical protein HY291_18035 [Planctomycetes bacterium]|nr:hypothetical protein [Planctomycetota bacterium]
MDAELFKQRLAETLAWCLPKAGATARDGLRAESLKPVLIHDRELPPGQKPDARKGETWFQFLMGAGERSWADVVADLAARRAEELLQAQPGFKDNLPDLTQGHLLLFEDDLSELSGTSETASQGFINACDVAPWDTWVDFLPKSPAQRSALLISWVPPAFLALVEAGIAANETDCLWLTPCTPDLPALLAKREAHYRTLEREEE